MDQPPIHPFPYDPFQQRAIEVIDRGTSLFVAAPTGSGKTGLAGRRQGGSERRQDVVFRSDAAVTRTGAPRNRRRARSYLT